MKKNHKRIAAIICIVLLLLLYIATLIVSILDFPGQDKLFAACLGATIGLPILLWLYIGLFGKLLERPTMADLFPEASDSSPSDEAKSMQNPEENTQ